MCGVVKSPAFEQDLTSEHCGTIELNEAGVGFVILPAHFPDPTYSSRHKGGPTGGVQPTALFQIVYSLTAVGTAMPHLHVLREVARLKSAADFTATVRGSGSGSVINPTISPTAVTNKSPYEKSNIKGQASKKITTISSHEGIAKGHTEHSGHAASGAPTGPGSDERVTSNRSSSPDDWWNAVRLEEITSSINKNSSGNANKAGRIPRASSTGNLPSAVSSALAGIPKAQSHSNLANSDRTVHNDRLIDGPLPLMGPNGLVESYRRRFRANKDASVVSSNDQIQNGSTSHLISATTATTSNLLNGGSPLMHNSESNESTDESTAVAPSPDGRRRPRPLCFFVAGGAPHGRVSWVVKTVPLSNSVIEAKAHNVYHDWRSIS